MSNTYPATCLGSGMRSTSPKQFLRYGNHTGYCCQALSTPKITYPFLFIAKLICSGKAARCSEKTHSDGRWLWCKNAYRGDGKKPKTSLWTKAWSQFILCTEAWRVKATNQAKLFPGHQSHYIKIKYLCDLYLPVTQPGQHATVLKDTLASCNKYWSPHLQNQCKTQSSTTTTTGTTKKLESKLLFPYMNGK